MLKIRLEEHQENTMRRTPSKPLKKIWEENFGRDSGRKKDVGRKFRKITI